MQDLATQAITAQAGCVGGAIGVGLLPGINGDALTGAFAGAILFVVSSNHLTPLRKISYLVVSLVVGYLAAPEIVRLTPVRSIGIAAFLGSVLAISITLPLVKKVSGMDASGFFKKGGE